MKYVLIIIAAILISACSLKPIDRGQGHMLALHAVQQDLALFRSGHLVLRYPTVNPALDNYRVALIRDDQSYDYFARTRWVDFLPLVVQNHLIDSLSAANLFQSVSSEEHPRRPDYVLKTRITDFHAIYARNNPDGPPLIRIAMRFSLTGQGDDEGQYDFSVTAERMATSNSIAGVHEAFKAAFQDAQLDMLSRLRGAAG